MTNQRIGRPALLVALGLTFTSVATADPPPAQEPPALQALRKARDKGKAPASASPAQTASPAATAVPAKQGSVPILEKRDPGVRSAALAAMHAAARKATANQHRKARHRELRDRLHGREAPPALRVELRNHARRMSRLLRIRHLASADPTLLSRVEGAITRETARHERRVAALIAQAGRAPARPGDDDSTDDEAEE